MRAQWIYSREPRIALYKQSSISPKERGKHSEKETEIKVVKRTPPPLSLVGAATSIIFVATTQQMVCRDKQVFVATKHVFCRAKCMLVVTKALSRKNDVTTTITKQKTNKNAAISILLSRQNMSFVETKYVFCRDKICLFVATKVCLSRQNLSRQTRVLSRQT